MSPLAVSVVVLACIFAGAVLGILLRGRFPDGHLCPETKEVVKLVIGIVGTMTGMVLGLLVASAKSSFDEQRGGVSQLASNVAVLDRALAHFGPEAQGARDVLRESVADLVHRMWPSEPAPPGAASHPVGDGGRYDEVYNRILGLQPKNDAQRTTQAQALKIVHDTAQVLQGLSSQHGSSVPPIFLVLLAAWLSVTFGSYGLFAPRHATTVVVLFLGAFVVSSAVFLILELDQGLGGLIHISSEPLRNALLQLGK